MIHSGDSTQWNDTDGDGHGDNPFGTEGDWFPDDPTRWQDSDDGVAMKTMHSQTRSLRLWTQMVMDTVMMRTARIQMHSRMMRRNGPTPMVTA